MQRDGHASQPILGNKRKKRDLIEPLLYTHSTTKSSVDVELNTGFWAEILLAVTPRAAAMIASIEALAWSMDCETGRAELPACAGLEPGI